MRHTIRSALREERKARLSKHSVPPAMLIELEELDEELERVRAAQEDSQ